MTEQEKREMVIKGLEGCFDALVQSEHAIAENGVVMSSWQDRAKRIDAIREAIALLKAQEPVEPKKNDVEICGLRTWDWACPVCNTILAYRANYCSGCGRAVKWDV